MKKSREQNLKLINDVQSGQMSLSDLTGSNQKTIIITRPGQELSRSEIDKLVAEDKKRFPDNDCLPVRMLIVRDGQTFESIMRDKELEKRRIINTKK